MNTGIFTPVPYEESKVGFTLGGPMIQDKAFFSLLQKI